jgi:O-antigen ligase
MKDWFSSKMQPSPVLNGHPSDAAYALPAPLFYLLLTGVGAFFIGTIHFGSFSFNFLYVTLVISLILPVLLVIICVKTGSLSPFGFLLERRALLILTMFIPSFIAHWYSTLIWLLTYFFLSFCVCFQIGMQMIKNAPSAQQAKHRILNFYRTLLGGGLYISVYGLSQFFFKGLRALPPLEPPQTVYSQVSTFPVFYNMNATLLLLLIPMAHGLGRLTPFRLEKIGAFLLMGLFLLTMFLTYSRGGWLAFGIMALVFTVHQRRYKPLAVLMVVAGCFFWLNHMHLIERLTTIFSTEYLTNLKRIQYWGVALKMIQVKPITGFGIGSFQAWSSGFSAVSGFTPPVTPHNLYLHIASELGLPALLIFLILWAETLKRCWVNARDATTLEQRVTNQVGLLGLSALTVYFLLDL